MTKALLPQLLSLAGSRKRLGGSKLLSFKNDGVNGELTSATYPRDLSLLGTMTVGAPSHSFRLWC